MGTETFGAYLKKLRLKRNLGLREFARRIGMDVGNLSRIERTKTPPPRAMEILQRMTRVLGIKKGTEECNRLLDLSRADQTDRLAPDVAKYAAKHRFLRLLMRTVVNKKLQDRDLLKLARKIEETY